MIDAFITHIQAERRYSALTVRNYRHDIESFAAWCAARAGVSTEMIDLRDVTTEDIREWIMHRVDHDKISAASMNRELSSLRSFYRYLRHHNHITQDIFGRISALRTMRRLPTFVPESRMADLLDNIREKSAENTLREQRDALIIALFYSCGIRLAELCNMHIGDFSDNYSVLRVRGKGNKERILPVLPEMSERVQKYVALLDKKGLSTHATAPLIVSEEGTPLSRSTIQRVVKRQLCEANVQGKKSPHILRHTFATHLLNRDADMREIQELMGHSSLKTTQCYTHNSITQLQAVYEKAHPHK
ncbi:MAG: tyrosine-type recombinase/integrase [Alistipes sp.]|nr:tyrosine-type recombinase/integrase [Alistipes sp.]